MAISNINNYISNNEQFKLTFYKAYGVARTLLGTTWKSLPNAGSTPSTAVTCDNTTIGALNKETSIGVSSYDWRLTSVQLTSSADSQLLLIDRLSHQGGLVANTTSPQTTNLPTAALTRYTNGHNVMAGVEILATLGSTVTTATVSYTNQNGTSGKTSKPFVIGGTNYFELNRILFIPLDDGDTGVRSVESVTLAADTTTAGNFGIFLFKVLAMANPTKDARYSANTYNALLGGACHFEPILPGACLMLINNGQSSGSPCSGNITFTNV
ncbi:MAG: hypothetical protein EKK64_04910 [Neisseriaceae bacterium]|nr:MAG: hypothetical protein EKK64_04910 [Neisseriaceae bacterium]